MNNRSLLFDFTIVWNLCTAAVRSDILVLVHRLICVVVSQMLKLMSKVEDLYTKYFSDGDHKKAVSELRPTRKQGTHRTTYFLGRQGGH